MYTLYYYSYITMYTLYYYSYITMCILYVLCTLVNVVSEGHRNVKIHSLGQGKGDPFFVMEQVSIGTQGK